MRYFHVVGIFLSTSRFALLAGTVCLLVILWHRRPAVPSLSNTATQTQHTTRVSQPYPHQECQAMFNIDKGNAEATWNSDEPYIDLSHRLPPLLADSSLMVNTSSNSALAVVYPGTRLQLLGGIIPYIPCQVRQYNVTDVGRCTAARAAKGGKTWIAFVGDSNQRQKTHSFLDFLPTDLIYTYYLGKKKVSLEDFTYAVAHHKHRLPTYDIIGRRPSSKSTSIHSHKTSDYFHSDIGYTDDHTPHEPENNGDHDSSTEHEDSNVGNSSYNEDVRYAKHIEQLTETREEIVRILSGAIDYKKPESPDEPLLEEDVSPEGVELRVTLVWAPAGSVRDPNFMESNIRQPKVTKLKEWTTAEVIPDVIIIGLGTWLLLMREYHDELVPFTELDTLTQPLVKPLTLLASRTHLLVWSQSRYRWFNFEGEIGPVQPGKYEEFWKQTLYLNQFHDTIPTMDAWLWRILRSTGAWRWDSTLPFNLANIHECLLLKNAQIFNDPVYRGNWWNCADVHHSSYETNSVEIQMLLNLLCNPYLPTDQQYCCSGK